MTIDLGQRAQQQAQMEAMLAAEERMIASRIYATLVAGMGGQVTAEMFREAAQFAKTAAPFLLEAFGFAKSGLPPRQDQTDPSIV